MENWKQVHPYVEATQIRQFGSEKIQVEQAIPPTVLNKSVDFQTVYFAVDDAKREVFNRCRRGRRLSAVKITCAEVQDILSKMEDYLYSHCKPNQ